MKNSKIILIVILIIALIGFSQIGKSQGTFHVYLTETLDHVKEKARQAPLSDLVAKFLRKLLPSE